MSLKQIQKDVDEFTSQFKVQYWKPHEILADMMEELGEIAREVNQTFGEKNKKPTEEVKELGDEMADLLFSFCCLANSLDIDIDEAWQRKIKKSYGRDNQRYERK